MDFRERYKFDTENDLIGKGGFSRVYKAFDRVRKREVALKFYHGTVHQKYDVLSEINRMENLIHPNLIRYFDATVISNQNVLGERDDIQVGIMEYANYGDIRRLSFRKEPELFQSIFSDVLKGLQFLHSHGLIHRDIKPKNILLHESAGKVSAKIADFGIIKPLGEEDSNESTQLLGSVEYMAPEQFDPVGFGIDRAIHTNVDLWSIGIIIYEMITGHSPFGSRAKGESNEQIFNQILFGELNIDFDALPPPFNEVTRRCLERKAIDRVRKAEVLIDLLQGSSKAQIHVSQKVKEVEPVQREEKEQSVPLIEEYETQVIPIRSLTPDQKTRIELGKSLFKKNDFIGSYEYLRQFQSEQLDVEARFYLGYMLYNGKCGGDHDFKDGKKLMESAKVENRRLVMQLMINQVTKPS